MMEIVGSHLCQDGRRMDVMRLLQLMDLCTCAAAEKHTGVNCVTVSMSDVVFETYPILGDVLELLARPVLTGNTSLDIHLTVTAEGNGGLRSMVCKASFVYVTTRGPHGEKRLCPPLEEGNSNGRNVVYEDDESWHWEAKVAKHRRNLVQLERKNSLEHEGDGDNDKGDSTPTFDLISTEVVLPAAQNHMEDTLGGQVMEWMAKAAMAVSARRSQRSTIFLVIRAILRVDFRCGSQVSDHLIFRTRLTAIFDEGRSAEIEVQVSKRSLASGQETNMNTGYFYISGSEIGTGTDVPFMAGSESQDTTSVIYHQAVWRRSQALARRQLLAGLGGPVKWHPALREEAPLLTIESVLRLIRHHDGAVKWNSCDVKPANTTGTIESVEWARGDAWGRKDTTALRVKGAVTGISLGGLLDRLRSQRPQWDSSCQSITVVEKQRENAGEGGTATASLPYDIVLHEALTPKVMLGIGDDDLSDCDSVVSFCRLRTWELNEESKTAIFASQSVRHPAAEATGKVRPSGWFLDAQLDGSIHVTYIAEHDLLALKRVTGVVDDCRIVNVLAFLITKWFENLQDMQ